MSDVFVKVVTKKKNNRSLACEASLPQKFVLPSVRLYVLSLYIHSHCVHKLLTLTPDIAQRKPSNHRNCKNEKDTAQRFIGNSVDQPLLAF